MSYYNNSNNNIYNGNGHSNGNLNNYIPSPSRSTGPSPMSTPIPTPGSGPGTPVYPDMGGTGYGGAFGQGGGAGASGGPGITGATGAGAGAGATGDGPITNNPKVQPLLCSGHTRPVTHLQFSNILDDGTYLLISGCKDGSPMLRSWIGDWIGTFIGHKGAVWSTKISMDASRAVTGSADFSAKIWDCNTGEAMHTFQHKHIVRSVALSPQAQPQYLLTGGNEKKIRLFDLTRPDAEPLVLGSNPDGLSCDGTVRSIVWDDSNGGTTGVSAAEDGVVRWWDLRTLKETSQLDLGESVTSMEMAHGGGTLSVTAGKKVHFLDILRQHPPVTIALPHPPTSASLHPYLRDRFVVGSLNDPWVRVYDLDAGKEREVYKGHHGPVHCASYSPDGEVYASGSEDGTIRLWQTSPGKSYGLWQTSE